jgi:dipeptidyl aminopeptidase/acylaminoacyl peptidase
MVAEDATEGHTMPHPSVWIPALASLVLASAAAAAPLEVYGRLPTLEDAALSPDGSSIAFVRTTQDQRLIVIFSLKEHRFIGGVRIGDQKLRAVQWADNDHVLLTTSSTGLPWGFIGPDAELALMQAYDVHKHKSRPLLDSVRDVRALNVVWNEPMIRREGNDTVVYLHGYCVGDSTTPGLFKVNLRTGTERVVRQGTEDTVEWLVDDKGQVAVEEGYRERDRRWAFKTPRDGHLQEAVSGTEAIDRPDLLGFDAAGESVIVSLIENDEVVWRKLSIKDGKWGETFAGEGAHAGVVVDEFSQRIIGTRLVAQEPKYAFFDPDLQERWDWALRQYRGERVELVSLSQNRSKALLLVTGPRSGHRYQLADFDDRLVETVGDVYDGLDVIAEVRSVTYAAADGYQIPAFLTLPPGRPAKNLPLVILPHGGPEAHDELHFDWWAQALAAQGYAVLQANFRGSNLSLDQVRAGFGEWGRKMQSDLSDGLRYLVAQGIADPRRACIVGASYGGYAALAGATLEPGTYRCAVSVAGISDLRAFGHWIEDRTRHGEKTARRYWDRFLGVSSPDDPKLNDISPIRHVPAVIIPVMLIHGRDDTVVPYDQSTDMVKALQRAGKTVEFVSLKKEDHWLSRGETRLQLLNSTVEFLRRNNPPD